MKTGPLATIVMRFVRENSLLFALPVIVLVGWADYVTGPDYGMSLFYLLPVVLVAWFTGGAEGITCGVAAAACWFTVDYAEHPIHVSAWNSLSRLVIFAGSGYLVGRVRVDRQQLQALNGAMQVALEREATLARTDATTGLANVRAFTEHLKREAARAKREDRSLSLLFIDLDNFKSVNDAYGHSVGDDVLHRVAQEILHEVRACDLAARIGGDEFAILLWHVEPADTGAIAGRISARIEAVGGEYPHASLGASIGWSHFPTPPADPESMIRDADRLMYQRKGDKRVVAEEDENVSM